MRRTSSSACSKNSVEQARFAYDPMRRRVEKVAGGVTTTYTHDQASILREISGVTTLKYVQGPSIDEPLATEGGTGLSYLHADVLGSVTKTTSGAGSVMLTRRYDAWGNLELGATTGGYAFTGREWDPEAALYFYRARSFDPKLGRFVSEDPAGFADGPNKYAYVRNRPADAIDPTGRVSTSTFCSRPGNAFTCMNGSLCAGLASLAMIGFPDSGPGNAVKHCVWACCSARMSGAQAAYEVTTSHEFDSRHPCDSNMDMTNNAAGIAFGLANSGSCFDLCKADHIKCWPDKPPCQRGNY